MRAGDIEAPVESNKQIDFLSLNTKKESGIEQKGTKGFSMSFSFSHAYRENE